MILPVEMAGKFRLRENVVERDQDAAAGRHVAAMEALPHDRVQAGLEVRLGVVGGEVRDRTQRLGRFGRQLRIDVHQHLDLCFPAHGATMRDRDGSINRGNA